MPDTEIPLPPIQTAPRKAKIDWRSLARILELERERDWPELQQELRYMDWQAILDEIPEEPDWLEEMPRDISDAIGFWTEIEKKKNEWYTYMTGRMMRIAVDQCRATRQKKQREKREQEAREEYARPETARRTEEKPPPPPAKPERQIVKIKPTPQIQKKEAKPTESHLIPDHEAIAEEKETKEEEEEKAAAETIIPFPK